ncbi:LysE family translocator [Pseudomonas proteolytica]|uniref:Threonine transporter RhtB n=1 Tax=Pseudomonas proteolytica TaxID=219574 RepID=A0AAW5ABJ8_9PSED|nr:LysE family transporter [Pseudomonas proteolytica]KAA8701693.1 threonine transporter RhtB [Pseudomonas proteolytica]MCF5058573.1 threonine transporter RhtB [Pseudomonas proteolytica]MCF5101027.1 threonine transporter RhtB [Pseudomonas proteolytica]NMZ05114.1 LysE family transporter [Pseudomonas proteolytica]TWR79131.1 threonine transporter RhtB [Pseudomonas proteolytica]
MLNVMSALGLLLLMPGPTNTLLLRSGVLSGFRRAWTLSLLECLAYLLQISFWGYLLSHMGASAPWCLKVMQFVSICYLAKTSYCLWREPTVGLPAIPGARVSRRQFFLLTLINPKGLLVVSFIVPVQTFADTALYGQFVMQFTAVVIPVGCAWVLFGARIKRSGHAWLTPQNINRTASVVISCFALAILFKLADALIRTGPAL